MHPSKPLKLIALVYTCFGIVSCSTDSETGTVSTSAIKGSLRFEHRTEQRRDGKTKLTVIAASGIAQDAASLERAAQTYAESFANSTCPKGYDFYSDAPLQAQKSERVYVFQCK